MAYTKKVMAELGSVGSIVAQLDYAAADIDLAAQTAYPPVGHGIYVNSAGNVTYTLVADNSSHTKAFEPGYHPLAVVTITSATTTAGLQFIYWSSASK